MKISKIIIFLFFLIINKIIAGPCAGGTWEWDDDGLNIHGSNNSAYCNYKTTNTGGHGIYIANISGHGLIAQPYYRFFANIFEVLAKESIKIFELENTLEDGEEFEVFFQIPSCWSVFDYTLKDNLYFVPCEGQSCCNVILTLQWIDDEVIIRYKNNDPYLPAPDCMSLTTPNGDFSPCFFICEALDLIHTVPYPPDPVHSPCFNDCTEKTEFIDFDGIDGIPYEEGGGNVKISPKYEIYKCNDVQYISIEDVEYKSGEGWEQMTLPDINKFLMDYALKYLTDDNFTEQIVKIRIPCFDKNGLGLQPQDPELCPCCEKTLKVQKTALGTHVTVMENGCPEDPNTPGTEDYDPTEPILVDYELSENCNEKCYWRIDGNSETDGDNFLGTTDGTNQPLIIKTNGTERMRIAADGIINFGTYNNSFLKVTDNVTFDVGSTSNPKPLIIKTGSDERMRVSENGNILFGNETTNFLTVTNTGDFNFRLFSIKEKPTDNKIGIDLDDNKLNIGPDFIANASGDVAGYMVAIGGLLVAKEIIVSDAQGLWKDEWPDYVLKSDYKLPSLYDIENYIKANGHLPEIPTQKDVSSDGVNLVKMQAILLKKIEELTLYMIELKKENENLRQEIKEIKR